MGTETFSINPSRKKKNRMGPTSVTLLSWCGMIQTTYYHLKNKIFYATIQLKMQQFKNVDKKEVGNNIICGVNQRNAILAW